MSSVPVAGSGPTHPTPTHPAPTRPSSPGGPPQPTNPNPSSPTPPQRHAIRLSNGGRKWLAILAAGALLSMGATCADGAPANGGSGQNQAAAMHVRLVVQVDYRPAGGTVTISYSTPEHNDTARVSAHKASKWTHDADLPPHDGFVATVSQSTVGDVWCWFEEITPTGQRIDQISPKEHLSTTHAELECTYMRGAVD